MTKSSSRPVRLASFQVRVIATEDLASVNAITSLVGEYMCKSDVHYCAEKEAIDVVNNRIEAGIGYEFTYLIYKVSKELNENEEPKEFTLVSKVYADQNTDQVVID